MAYILEKIGNTYNLPKKYFTCDAKSDLDGISLVDVPIGSEAYCILEEESYILDSNKQWHKKKIGDDLTGQVQADLSQTDSTQANYIKGIIRKESLPEGYPYKEDNRTIIEWDGNTEGRPSFVNKTSGAYKVSDEVFDNLTGCPITFIAGDEVIELTLFEGIQVLDNVYSYGSNVNQTSVLVVLGENELNLEIGIYFFKYSMSDMIIYVSKLTAGSEIVYPIASEFLPKLTLDSTPTADSTNPVTSGGVKNALDGKMSLAAINAQMPSYLNWNSVTYGDGKFVAVAYSSDKAAYSEDGINWTVSTMPSSESWKSVTYGNGKFIAVVQNSTQAVYSEDGINWTASTMPNSANWSFVIYGNGKFVAVAYGSDKAVYSEDGINWTASTMPSSATWYSVTYGNGKFVSVAYGSDKAAYSEDGISWTASTIPSSNAWRSVTYGNGKFVAVAGTFDKAVYSEDGINWTASTIPSSDWYSVTYGNGKFVTVAYGSDKAAYSEDGINWTLSTMPSSAKWYSVTYGNGKFVAIASSSAQAAYSEDGITWKTTFEYISQNNSNITESVRSVIGIPAYSTANNGQFLRVIDGIPTWTTIANAEGGTY